MDEEVVKAAKAIFDSVASDLWDGDDQGDRWEVKAVVENKFIAAICLAMEQAYKHGLEDGDVPPVPEGYR